jgi:uncharacterized protein YbjT (DUF2867 family)
MGHVFITGGTGYIGLRLIRVLLEHGHRVTALIRPESEHKLPPELKSMGCEVVLGNALQGASYEQYLRPEDTFVQLVGVSHPSPAKAKQFVEIDQKSAMEAIRVASAVGVSHFVYVSVAHPAPAMHSYIEARTACEAALVASGLNATVLRPWYVLGPGHWWPYALIPFYWLAQRIPSTRETAQRLGLVTIDQMVAALVDAVEHPATRVRVVEVPEIRTKA